MIKLVLKRVLLMLGVLGASPLIILSWLEALIRSDGSERVYAECVDLISACPTIIGQYLRLAFYWASCRDVSPDSCFMIGARLAHRDVAIGPNVHLGAYTIIGRATVGPNVLFAPHVSVISGKYAHGRPGDRAAGLEYDGTYDEITIGRDSWIGQHTVIMAHVGERCTIAAGAVLYKDAPDMSTFMGNPARKVSL